MNLANNCSNATTEFTKTRMPVVSEKYSVIAGPNSRAMSTAREVLRTFIRVGILASKIESVVIQEEKNIVSVRRQSL
jgi:hypothetical protein